MAPEAGNRCGILLLDKPPGMSSNAALQRVRRLLGRPKAGHTGSLDPLATGMLPICVGEATKLAGALLDGAKGYTVQMRLGERTETGDTEGAIIERVAVPPLDRSAIEAAFATLRGPQLQVPPMHSALKRDGQPLYKLARQGLSVERAPRAVEIRRLELLEFTADGLRAQVECTKGTYIRTLAEQIGGALGTVAHVTSLRRDFVEPFRDSPMLTLAQLEARPGEPTLLAADLAVGHLYGLRLSPAQARAIGHGQQIEAEAPMGPLRLYDSSGAFLGLGRGLGAGRVAAARLFAEAIARLP
ncbi:MAG: tRNA pseudouridine(55) synthase TruB [Gammaproteobacteria bacterium]|nr:tRNA pseudouridine(55) synthase TruB [Gammaproteobacteria bacterium]MDE2252493.1 tRNA pseudouridine(55) synthase TruB [Gammaproteobacteria bacterium]